MQFQLTTGEIIKINEKRIVERGHHNGMELILVNTTDPKKEILYCGKEVTK